MSEVAAHEIHIGPADELSMDALHKARRDWLMTNPRRPEQQTIVHVPQSREWDLRTLPRYAPDAYHPRGPLGAGELGPFQFRWILGQ